MVLYIPLTTTKGKYAILHFKKTKDESSGYLKLDQIPEINGAIVVIDPRNVFADPKRFTIPPDKLESKWPEDVLPELSLDEDTYVILLTHDPKIDDPALHILLKNNLAYIGALGSKRTHSKRCARLKEAGFDGASIDRIKGPAGIEIGAQSAAEIALSMITEVVAVKHRKI